MPKNYNPRLGIAFDIFGDQVSGVTTFMRGSPYGAGFNVSSGGGNQNITGSYTEGARLKLLCNPMAGNSNPYSRLSASCFALPSVGSIGLESGVNYLTGPGINNGFGSVNGARDPRILMTMIRIRF